MEEIKKQIEKINLDSQEQIRIIRNSTSDLVDIAFSTGIQEELADILLSESKVINNRLSNIDTNIENMKRLLDQISMDKPEKSSQKDKDDDISLRPSSSYKRSSSMPSGIKIGNNDNIPPPVETQRELMRELHSLQNTDSRYLDFTGIYPRINFIQDSSPTEIRKWYDFGAINSIYISPPDFNEIRLLPFWLQEGVKDVYFHNPTVGPKDILMLKFYSAGPDFYKENRYPAYHFIQISKAMPYSIPPHPRKEFIKFDEKDIHYRRAIGMRIILQTMENSYKKGFRTYGGQKMHSSVMISPAKQTPPSAHRYLNTKINWIDTGIIESSPSAQARLCQFRSHKKGTCPTCSPEKIPEKMPAQKTKDNDSATTTDTD